MVSPRDPRPGPRIGMVHDCDFYHYFLDHGTYPDEGMKGSAYSNSGVFLIKPGKLNRMKILNLNIYSNLDREEFLYLINLKNSSLVEPHPWSSGGEQGFINEVYLWERLDLGLHNNLFMHYILVTENLIISSHFSMIYCVTILRMPSTKTLLQTSHPLSTILLGGSQKKFAQMILQSGSLAICISFTLAKYVVIKKSFLVSE